MTAIPPGLTVRDAQILELLRGGASRARTAAIGRHRRAWAPEDVDEVIAIHITPPPEARQAVWRPQPFAGVARDVVLTQRLVAVLDDVCAGLNNAEIAAAHRRSENTIAAQVKTLMRALTATSRIEMVALVLTGRVRVLVPIQKPQKAAS